MLRLRFQAKITTDRPTLETLSLSTLVDLSELAATVETLADFEAHLPD